MIADDYLKLEVEYQHYVERYKNTLASGLLLIFDRMIKDIFKEIKALYPERWTVTAMNKIKKAVSDIIKQYRAEIETALEQESEGFYVDAVEKRIGFINGLLEKLEATAKAQMPSKTDFSSFPQYKATFDDYSVYTVAGLLDIVFNSLSRSITMAVERARALSVPSGEFVDSTSKTVNTARNGLNTMTDTAVAMASAFALRNVITENPNIFKGYQWISVLDKRTTPGCEYRHDRVWYYGRPELSTLPYEEYPPRHPRCRSMTIPIFTSAVELGITGAVVTDKPATELSYSEWFDNLPTARKKEILGPSRYSMYSKGEIKIDQFYSTDGRYFTLKELQSKGFETP